MYLDTTKLHTSTDAQIANTPASTTGTGASGTQQARKQTPKVPTQSTQQTLHTTTYKHYEPADDNSAHLHFLLQQAYALWMPRTIAKYSASAGWKVAKHSVGRSNRIPVAGRKSPPPSYSPKHSLISTGTQMGSNPHLPKQTPCCCLNASNTVSRQQAVSPQKVPLNHPCYQERTLLSLVLGTTVPCTCTCESKRSPQPLPLGVLDAGICSRVCDKATNDRQWLHATVPDVLPDRTTASRLTQDTKQAHGRSITTSCLLTLALALPRCRSVPPAHNLVRCNNLAYHHKPTAGRAHRGGCCAPRRCGAPPCCRYCWPRRAPHMTATCPGAC